MLSYVICVLILFLLYIFTFKLRHKQLQFLIFAFIGIILMIISSMFYSIRKTGVYSGMAFVTFEFLYNISRHMNLTMTGIYRIALAGSFSVFCSLIAMGFNILPPKRVLWRFVFLIPSVLYMVLNDPDTNYWFYLNSATLFYNADNALVLLNIYNYTTIAFYLMIPVVAVFLYYRRTAFIIKKRHAVYMLLYIIVYYALIFVLNSVGLIHFSKWANIQILKYSDEFVTDITMTIILISIYIVLLFIAVLTYKNLQMQNYSAKAIYKNTNILDKNLRMILHTYKNYFYIINQQLVFLKNLNEPYSDKAVETLNALDTFSLNALDEISERINALQNIKLLYKPVNLIDCADLAVSKLFVPPGVKIIKDYRCDKAMLFTEKKCITEMIFNLLQNSLEAFYSINPQEKEPTIRIMVDSEPDWILLEITDNGCGIGKKEKKAIFAPLFSGKQGKNNFGIGLHYVKKIIQAHKGYIFVDSLPGEYTTFQVYLPAISNGKDTRTWSKLKLKS